MHIHGTTPIHGPHGPNAPHFAQRAQSAEGSAAAAGADRVEISAAAREASQAAETGRVRQSLVNSIRAQIAAGTYDTPEKFEAAFDRMIDQIV